MIRILLIVCVILSAIPNYNIASGLPLLDVMVLLMIMVHSANSKEIFVELSLFVCLLFVVFVYRYSFNELDLLEYLNYALRYVLLYGLLLIPSKYYIISRGNMIWTVLPILLLLNAGHGISKMILQGFSRREMEYTYFNDINMLFFTLFLTLIISRRSHFILNACALILSVISGARLASLLGLYLLFRHIGKNTSIFLLLMMTIAYLLMPETWLDNALLLDRLTSGLNNDEYSRGALWLVYISSLADACSWCYIYQEFSSMGRNIMRPAHNFFLSTLSINGLLAGIVIVWRALFRLRGLLNIKHFWVILLLFFFDIQFSRGIFLLIMIYNSSRHERSSGFDLSI